MEVELRARIKDVYTVKEKIDTKSVETLSWKSSRQVDLYLKHQLDVNRDLVIRFRTDGCSTDGLLTFKGASKHSSDIAWDDFDVGISRVDRLQGLLLSNGFCRVCEIDKSRQSAKFLSIEVNLDRVDKLGDFIEVEKIVDSESEVDTALEELKNFLSTIDVEDSHIISEGYVPLMMRPA